MALGFAFLLGPLLLYAILVAIPAGRQAAIGVGLWALPLAFGWLALAFAREPLLTGTPRADAEATWLLLLWTLPVLLAGAVQLARRRLGRLYPWAALALPLATLGALLPPLAL